MIDTYCGLSCKNCELKEQYNCGGCIATKGHPFHGECEIAECAKKKNKQFCGECENLPCETIIRYSNDDEHGDTPKGARIEQCRIIKNTLVKKARKGSSPISYCGHHCDFCFLKQDCGGCRSNYNLCSFALLFEDRKCPNAQCAQEKGINGCYVCDELKYCKKGYYARPNEYIAKATALFIKEHGEACYTTTLRKAIANGINYPKTFDASGSIEKAMAILENYI